MTLIIDPNRLREWFDDYSKIGETDKGGLNRIALSDADKRCRDQFLDDCAKLGLETRIDELGNVFARRSGLRNLPPVMIGSHLDSQPYGGRYDGQLGVLAGLETIASLNDASVDTIRPIDIVNWTNEEGTRFQPSMMGSGTFSGIHDASEMLRVTDNNGITVGEELQRIGYDGDISCEPIDVDAYIELHIEQGSRLEEEQKSVGIVEGIYGLAWLSVDVEGESNHAGSTPMYNRRDAMQASASAIESIGTLPSRLSDDAVTTIGVIRANPNSINVISDHVSFSVDVRSYDDDVIETGVGKIRSEIAAACDRHNCNYEIDSLSRHYSVDFSSVIRSTLSDVADATNVSKLSLVSGAGHDAQHLQTITDAGMLFVPSVGGKTHVESEYTTWDDCVAGTSVLAEATRRLASE